jgi:G3E family GTPase
MALQKIITVLDADFWEAREAFGPLFYNQLDMANLILLNKVDLMEPSKIPDFLKEIHEEIMDSQVVPTIYCRVDPETLWTESTPRIPGLKPIDFFQKGRDRQSVDADNFVSFAFETSLPLDEVRFGLFLDELPFEVFRVKGPVRFSDRTAMLNFVGGRGEWSPWAPDAKTQLVFIGWGIDSREVLRKAEACISP